VKEGRLMKRTIIYFLLTSLMIIGWAFSGIAADGWQANITVSSEAASTRLTFGLMSDATDMNDGLYDVPAMLSGSLKAYFSGGGGALWRDIRAAGSDQEWNLVYDADDRIFLRWDQKSFPEDANVGLIDSFADKVVNMKTLSSYSPGIRTSGELLIKVTGN